MRIELPAAAPVPTHDNSAGRLCDVSNGVMDHAMADGDELMLYGTYREFC